MLASNLLLGVQACYRGPRLYDTEKTKFAVQKWVKLYKKHRDILESDLLHLRRADGQDLDYMLHVNSKLQTKGFLAVFNPTDKAIKKEVLLPLYYTGLTNKAKMRIKDGSTQEIKLDGRQRARIKLSIPANGISWITFE